MAIEFIPIKPQPPSHVVSFEFVGDLNARQEHHRRIWAGYGDVERDWAMPLRMRGLPEWMLQGKSRPQSIELWCEHCPLAIGEFIDAHGTIKAIKEIRIGQMLGCWCWVFELEDEDSAGEFRL